MRINIKFIEECSKGEYGTCQITSRNNIDIKISRKLNKNRSEFFVTILHEMLHAWMFILKANGIKISVIKEHKWIYNVQYVVVKALEMISRKRKYNNGRNKNSRVRPLLGS